MAELTTTASAYATGSIDTWSNRTNDPGGDEIRAEHVNGLGSAIVQIETVLGDGTALKGSKTDLATRLAVQMLSNGIIIPVGSMFMYGGAVAPTGYLLGDQDVSRTTYSDLFAVYGTSYGTGDGSTTFGLPRFAGRIPVGVGTGTGGGTSGTGNPTGGSALTAVARGTWKGTENAVTISHGHTIVDPGHSHNENARFNDSGSSLSSTANLNDSGSVTSFGINTDSSTTGITINTTGVSGTGLNIQPVIGVNIIIKY